MKVDVTQCLTAIDGQPLQDDGQPILLRTACINALMATLQEDQKQTGEEKLNAWTLAKRLQEEDQPDLKVEEVAKLKERVGLCYSPAIVGPAYQILDGTAPKPTDEE